LILITIVILFVSTLYTMYYIAGQLNLLGDTDLFEVDIGTNATLVLPADSEDTIDKRIDELNIPPNAKDSELSHLQEIINKKYHEEIKSGRRKIWLKRIHKVNTKLLFLSLLFYPIYLLYRFIIWAIRTLRKK